MKFIDYIGLCAAVITSFAMLPQVIKVVKTGDTKSLSVVMFGLFMAGVSLWLIYGIFLKNIPMIGANALTLIFAGIILFYKIKEIRSNRSR